MYNNAFVLNDEELNVAISRTKNGYLLYIGDDVLPINLHKENDDFSILTVLGKRQAVMLAVHGDDVHIHMGGETYLLKYRNPLDRLAAKSRGAADDFIRAPMPGSIVSLNIAIGEAVSAGQTLLIMESMKMESTILAPRDGVVATVNFEKGQTFDRNAVLLTLEEKA
ncbi:MAG: hypothetical protein LBH14_08065 [Desulfobulbaceae bacterium]|nr:hypothetical protein [Desulfobulbaceae bacterium]